MNPLKAEDLDASLQMLVFMWLASGNDAGAVTPEGLATIRTLIAQGYPQLPLEIQMLFRNGTLNFGEIRSDWEAADPSMRIFLAQKYQQLLNTLGLNPQTAAAPPASQATANDGSLISDLVSNAAWMKSGAGNWSSR